MAPKREQELPVESSWRMVEGGENDSFDTSIVPDLEDDEYEIPLSSGPSHLSSQDRLSSVGGSQESNHSIHDFVDRAHDERVILRSPFRPSVPATRQATGDRHRTPDPEFFMPSVHIESSRPSSSGRSSRTVRPVAEHGAAQRSLRRRPAQGQEQAQISTTKRRPREAGRGSSSKEWHGAGDESRGFFWQRVTDGLPGAVLDIIAWLCEVVGMALKLLKYPLAMALALYILVGGIIVLQNMATKSLYASLSPLCRIPGTSYLDLPFCPQFGQGFSSTGEPLDENAESRQQHVEFDDLMGVQANFEQVLERSADGVSLPMEMKRSESSVRDLRTMVRYSELPTRDELVHEFDEYIDTARRTASDLQKFNAHVGSAVDSVISINRWTSRYIDSLAPPPSGRASEVDGGGGSDVEQHEERSVVSRWASWLFYPFQPAYAPLFDERALTDKYVEHTALVSDRIASLIVEAQAVLRLLTRAEDHLSLIHELVARSRRDVRSRRDDVFWTIWTLVGANGRQIGHLDEQLGLLRSVETQRGRAVAQVSALVVELERIQAGLGDLRDRVAEPGLARDAIESGGGGGGSGGRGLGGAKASIPLSVHIETIDRGVERLEEARKRIRDAEDDKVREALARGGVKEADKLIEGRA